MTVVSTTIVTLPETGFLTPGDVYDKGLAFIQNAKLAAADGLTWSEFGELSSALMKLSTAFLDTVTRMGNDEKKRAVLDLVGRLFDAVADRCIPTIVYPFWLFVRSAVRAFVIAQAEGTMEQILELVRAPKEIPV